MSNDPKSKNPLWKDTILFIVMLPVAAIIIPVIAFVVPLIMGILKIFGLVDREPGRPNRIRTPTDST